MLILTFMKRVALAALLLGACRTSPAPPPREPATAAMARRLARLSKRYAADRLFVNPARIGLLRRKPGAEPGAPFEARLAFAQELLNAGETREAVAAFDELVARAPRERLAELRGWRGIAELRLGEQENCLLRHNASSCLLPIRGAGVHALKEGAAAAVEDFKAALELAPDSLPERWLLNVAAMAAGAYPAAVPPRWLIPPKAFEPEAPFPRFPDKAAAAGLDFTGHAGGAVSEDFRGVGLLDLLVSSQGLEDQLRYFRNDGDGTFTETTAEAGLTGLTGGLNLIAADYDNDGRVDVLVERGAWQRDGGHEPLSLLHNDGGGRFSDVAEKAGLLGDYQTQAAAFADFDGDGLLDLLVCNESYDAHHHPCQLFHNKGDGTFVDVAERAGLAVRDGAIKSVAVADFDGDGRPDAFLGRWGAGNLLFRQNADGTFTDVTRKAGVREPLDTFASWFFDYDGDGRPDILAFGFARPRAPGESQTAIGYRALESVAAEYLGRRFSDGRPRLYRNRGDGTFEDVTSAAGLDRALFTMGSNFADLDDDGHPDFYAGTGVPDLRGLMPNRLFRNVGGKRFVDVTAAADVGHLQKGHAVALGDLNNDGYPDIFAVLGGAYEGDVYQRALFVNPGGKNRWVGLLLEGTRSNRSAIGARLEVRAGGRLFRGTVSTGGSFGCSGLRQTIGLASARSIDELTVRWPSGAVERFSGAAPGAYFRLKEGTGRAEPLAAPRFAWR